MNRSKKDLFSAALAAMMTLSLAACGGGGTSPSAPVNTPTATPSPKTTPGTNLVTPTFTIVVPAKTKSSRGVRQPDYVSSASQSITITLTSVGGSAPNVTPTSATANISGSTCTVVNPCVVSGPPSPPGVADTYSLTTFDALNGTGNQLDTSSVTFTPTTGQSNATNVTMNGIPFAVSITGIPTSFNANVSGQTTNLTVTVTDHSGQTISGAYANTVRITDPDAETTNGTDLTGTHAGSGCANSCVDLTSDTDVATLNYGGLAENPVVLASSATGVTGGNAGTATFTPNLQAIVKDNGPTSQLGGDGVDLFTNDSGSSVGYSGTEQYKEPGFTNSPYNKTLSIAGTGACSGFAALSTGTNDTTHGTPFTATTIASPNAGQCTLSVTDNLTDQPNALPTFKVTFTTSTIGISARHRHN